MTELRTMRTAELDASTKPAVRSLLDPAFGVVSDDTFENALGGVHALVVEEGQLVGHGGVVQRRSWPGGRAPRWRGAVG